MLECLFYVNEIYLSYAIPVFEGKKKGPASLAEGAILNLIGEIGKPTLQNCRPSGTIDVPITKITELYIKSKMEWFSQQKSKGESHSFQSDQMVLLTFASNLVIDTPSNLQFLLSYQQETISHA